MKKNNQLADQLAELRNEILEKERMYRRVLVQIEEQIDRLRKQINIEKRDIMTRENTIAELQRKQKELLK